MKELKDGPIKKRKCTDCLCLFVFFAFVGLMITITTYAYKNEQFSKFLTPTDADGNYCGLDDGFVEYPYVYYAIQCRGFTPQFTLDLHVTPVCSTKCPVETEPV